MGSELHVRLVALQSDSELERKARKSHRRGTWVQEELDYALRIASRIVELFRHDTDQA